MSSKSALIARDLVLLGLALGLAGGPAGAATAEGGYATAELTGLAELLGQRGWHARADGGGNLLITRSSSGLQSPAPPTGGNRGLLQPEAAPAPAVDGWMAPLASRLGAGGWTVRLDAAAGLSFHRDVVAPRRPGSLGQGTIASRTALAQPAPDRLEALAAGLRQHVGGVEAGAGGTLTLHPPAGLPATPPAAAAPERVAAPWEPQIREALTRRGWDLRRDAAGKLLLMPTGLGLFSA